MKDKKVMVTFKSIQSNGEDKDEFELMTEGNYSKKDDGYVISYTESEVTGFDNSSVTLTTNSDRQILINRVGENSSTLCIEKDKKHHCLHETPFGNFMIGVTAKNITSSLNDDGGDISAHYIVDVNSSLISENQIFINIQNWRN